MSLLLLFQSAGGGGGVTFVPAWAANCNVVLQAGEDGFVIKNTASQKIGVQMVSAADGSAFTSAVTVAVTGDAGTQATGSVGSGACTHEGNGYHTYAPAQAETNYDIIGFTFTGSGAIPQTVQVFTKAGDAFTRLGAPAGASVSADLAAVAAYVDTEVAAVKAKTDNLPSDPADASDIAASFASIAATLTTIAAYIDTEVAAIKAKTDSLTFTQAGHVDANVQRVNDVALVGDGSGTPWGPA